MIVLFLVGVGIRNKCFFLVFNYFDDYCFLFEWDFNKLMSVVCYWRKEGCYY